RSRPALRRQFGADRAGALPAFLGIRERERARRAFGLGQIVADPVFDRATEGGLLRRIAKVHAVLPQALYGAETTVPYSVFPSTTNCLAERGNDAECYTTGS